MTHSEYISQLTSNINKLSDKGRIHFAVDLSRKLLPGYITFSEKHYWGDADVLSEAITFCQQHLLLEETDYKTIYGLVEKVEQNVPDTDEFSTFDGIYALNSSLAVIELLEYLLDKNQKHIMHISSYMIDNIDLKINADEDSLSLEELDMHALIIEERIRQLNMTAVPVASEI